MAYHEAAGVAVLSGGLQGNFPLDDVWTWDGRTWSKVFPTVVGGRPAAGMAYHGASQSILILGGESQKDWVNEFTRLTIACPQFFFPEIRKQSAVDPW